MCVSRATPSNHTAHRLSTLTNVRKLVSGHLSGTRHPGAPASTAMQTPHSPLSSGRLTSARHEHQSAQPEPKVARRRHELSANRTLYSAKDSYSVPPLMFAEMQPPNSCSAKIRARWNDDD